MSTPSRSQEAIVRCRASIARHSKSFALASRLLPRVSADRAACVYAWCRRADDAVDARPPAEQPAALARLRAELDSVYGGSEQQDLELAGFQAVAAECGIPPAYPEELLNGMEMDCRGTRYPSIDPLLTYSWRVAGCVGLMMCHVMGVRDAAALRRAAHMGIAMQLTNICRDVHEDWELGRLYLPGDRLAEAGAPGLEARLGQAFPDEARAPVAQVVAGLLREADRYYRSGDRGLAALSARCAFGVRTARLVYAAIGRRVERAGCDPLAGRAVVPLSEKLLHVGHAAARALLELPRRAAQRPELAALDGPVVRFPDDVLPVGEQGGGR